MARLVLIRHGETDYNLEKRYCGFSNPSLNDNGIRQAKVLADKLKNVGIDKIYSSDLERAYETARIVFKNRSIEKTEDFREMNFGIFEGLKSEEILEKYPKLYREWIDDPDKIELPEGEGLKDLSKRVKEKLPLIIPQDNDITIALVTHGGPIRIILCDAFKFDLKMFWQMKQEVGSLNMVDYPKKETIL